jgi:sugar-specific transcriptional regulator TrmB
MISLLEKLGLSEKEAKVYLAALELGEDSVQNIGKKASVNRATTYVILEKLMGLGLVSTYEKDKKTVFVAQDPKELVNLLAEERRNIETREKDLKENINQLTAVYNQNRGKPIVRFFEGADGLEAMDRYGQDALKKNTELLYIMPIDTIEDLFPQRRKASLGERVKLGIKSKVIYTHKNGEIPGYQNKAELREGIFIPREKFPINATLSIYPEWGIKLYYFDAVNPYGVVIEGKELAQNMKLFFDLAWVGAKEITKK